MTAAVLPPLREELTLHAAPCGADGSPTWSLQDPVRNRFFRIDWPTFLILSHWHLGRADVICAAVENESPLELTSEDVHTVLKFLAQSELIQCFDAAGARRLLSAQRHSRQSPWRWLLHHYLFFRIPLFRPDAWLARFAPRVDVFYSRAFRQLTFAALGVGLFETLQQWPHFKETFVDTLSWEGLTAYAAALVAIKTLHELGHAFTAKRYGCRVPTMGIAFLVMWPVAYTDVNETWKLADRRQRLAVGAAGVLTELAVASWATLAWSLLPDGALRGCAFLLAAVTWISSLAVNASPFMRFDGYFLLSDWLDIPNLHSRAFALARWRLREGLFALGEDKPEHFTPTRERLLIAFAVLTWLYRLALFIGIAVLIYQHVFKALGIALFVIEIAWFIVIPVSQEFQEWARRWPVIRTSRRARTSAVLALALLSVVFIPLDFHVSGQAVLRPAKTLVIYAPEAGVVIASPQAHGSAISAGQQVLQLSSPDLEYRIVVAHARRARLLAQQRAASLDESLQADLPVLREQLSAVNAELSGLTQEYARLAPLAAFTGTLVDPLLHLHPGDSVSRNERLVTLVDRSSWEARTYLEERDLARVSIGDTARFYPETAGSPPLDLVVLGIDRDASRTLPEALLASTHGGQIPVRADRETLVPERAVYAVTLRVNEPTAVRTLQQQRGRVVIRGQARTLFGEYFETAAAVVIRESSW